MNAEQLAKKEPMAMHGFTVLTPKQETAYDKMIQEKQAAMLECDGCGDGYKPVHPTSAPKDVPLETGKKNGKR